MSSVARRSWALIESRPLAADTALAATAMVLAVVASGPAVDVLAFSDPGYDAPSRLEELAGLLMVIGPLALRRRLPLATVVASTAGFVVARLALDQAENAVVPIALSFAVYSAAAHGRAGWRNVVCAVCLLAVMAELWHEVNIFIPPGFPNRRLYQVIQLLLNAALFAAMWALGAAIGASRRRAEVLLERTIALEREREASAHRAVFDERVRIARELHDVVAHHVSLMGVQAGAARLVMDGQPDKAKAALAAIESSSRQTVEELHRLLRFLRQADDPDGLALRPGVDQLPGLVAGMKDAELAVVVSVEGDERPLPPTVDVSAYRIVQEALTNTLKHAGATRAEVRLRYGVGELELEIVDDGRGTSGSSRSRGGLGVIGMRERAALHGGKLTTGPAPGGGFAVRAKLMTADAS